VTEDRTTEELVRRAAQPTVDALAAMEEGQEPAVRVLLADIRERFREPGYNVDDLRLELGKSNRHFYEGFRAAIGLAPWALVQDCRMDLASRLLSTTSLPIAEVAFHAGYYSVPAFQRLCRSWCGLLPGRLRLRLRELRPLLSRLPDALTWHFQMRCRRSELETGEVRRLVEVLEELYEAHGPVARENPVAVWERTAHERAKGDSRRGE
jgi:AraC-like DNA-binding protein